MGEGFKVFFVFAFILRINKSPNYVFLTFMFSVNCVSHLKTKYCIKQTTNYFVIEYLHVFSMFLFF